MLKYTNSILQRNPYDENALWGRAEFLYQLKRWKEAEEAFIKLKELFPSWANKAERYLEIIRGNLQN